jgi:peroxiredoxin
MRKLSNMNRLTLGALLAAALLATGCRSTKATLVGRFAGSEARSVYLEQVTPLTQTIIDSAALGPDGGYKFRLKDVAATPSLYNLVCNGERIPLLIAGGDRLTVNAVGSVVRNYTVDGSEETELLRQFYQPYVAGAQKLDAIAAQFARQDLAEAQRKALGKEYTAEYFRIRREQLRFIIENKASLAAVYALYQRLPGDTYLFNGDSDVVYFRTVAEAIEERYPESPYLQPLLGEIARMDARISLTSKVSEMGYPDLELHDIYGRKIRLSSLAGKVVLIDFWSAEAGNSNTLNAELKETYRKYADAPTSFEVYQVSLDTSKAAWITAVQEQRLPWISVSDLRGRASAAVGLYNISKLPANFLIDKNGTLVAKDIYGKSLERKLDELTR